MSAARKFLPSLFFAIVSVLVVWLVQPPESFAAASSFQLFLFFLPLLLFLIFLLNLFFKSLLHSFIISMGPVLLLLLKGFDIFNPFTILAVVAIIFFAARSVKKPSKSTYQPKIPKLSHLSRQR